MNGYETYPWQTGQMRRLQEIIEQERMPHAILFSGPAGIGKGHLARCLVYRLLKRHSQCADFENLLLAASHPDVARISPVDDKKQISVDQIRALSARLSLTPQIANIKLAIIDPAESMTTAAANALLKTLEEPPGHTLLMLLSHNYGRLSQTIRSRCHHIPLALPGTHESAAWLQDQGVANAREYLLLTRGAPLIALQAAENAWLEQHLELLNDLSGLMDNRLNMVSVAAHWRDHDLRLLLDWIKNLVVYLVKSRLNEEVTSDIAGNFLKSLKIPVNRIDLKKLMDYSQYLDKSALEIDNNLNRELVLEQLFTRWAVLAA
jgi:DNA polymerase-3 subunit delta'